VDPGGAFVPADQPPAVVPVLEQNAVSRGAGEVIPVAERTELTSDGGDGSTPWGLVIPAVAIAAVGAGLAFAPSRALGAPLPAGPAPGGWPSPAPSPAPPLLSEQIDDELGKLGDPEPAASPSLAAPPSPAAPASPAAPPPSPAAPASPAPPSPAAWTPSPYAEAEPPDPEGGAFRDAAAGVGIGFADPNLFAPPPPPHDSVHYKIDPRTGKVLNEVPDPPQDPGPAR
jgi:hypothetical protein